MEAEAVRRQDAAVSVNRLQIGLFAVTLLFFIGFFWPSIVFLIDRWSQSEEFSHGFLVPLVSLFILWRKWPVIRETPVQVCRWGLPVLGLGLLMQVASEWASVSFLKALALPVALGGLAWYLVGTRMMRVALFPYLFLYFAVPWPDFAIEALSVPLQHFSAAASTMFLGVLGVPIERDGVHMWTPRFRCGGGGPVQWHSVDGSHSGDCSAGGVFDSGQVVGERCAVFLAGIPITMLANVLRIAAIVVMGHYVSQEFAMTFFHDYSSPFLFFISALSLLGVKKLMEKVQ
jgi:exosortase/archaeosortase family protein